MNSVDESQPIFESLERLRPGGKGRFLTALLEAVDLGKSFVADNGDELEIIRSLSFTLGRGEIVSLVGPSGCGKTTLLNLLCCLLGPSRGAVLWHG